MASRLNCASTRSRPACPIRRPRSCLSNNPAIAAPIAMMGEVAADLSLPYLMSFIINYGIAGIDVNSAADGSKTAAALTACGSPA